MTRKEDERERDREGKRQERGREKLKDGKRG